MKRLLRMTGWWFVLRAGGPHKHDLYGRLALRGLGSIGFPWVRVLQPYLSAHGVRASTRLWGRKRVRRPFFDTHVRL
jgi:hypothetical protein